MVHAYSAGRLDERTTRVEVVNNVKDVGQVYDSITGQINTLQTMRCRAPS